MTKRNIPYIHTLHLALTPRSREEPKNFAVATARFFVLDASLFV